MKIRFIGFSFVIDFNKASEITVYLNKAVIVHSTKNKIIEIPKGTEDDVKKLRKMGYKFNVLEE